MTWRTVTTVMARLVLWCLTWTVVTATVSWECVPSSPTVACVGYDVTLEWCYVSDGSVPFKFWYHNDTQKPLLTYETSRDDVVEPDTGKYDAVAHGSRAELTIHDVTAEDAGMYSVHLSQPDTGQPAKSTAALEVYNADAPELIPRVFVGDSEGGHSEFVEVSDNVTHIMVNTLKQADIRLYTADVLRTSCPSALECTTEIKMADMTSDVTVVKVIVSYGVCQPAEQVLYLKHTVRVTAQEQPAMLETYVVVLITVAVILLLIVVLTVVGLYCHFRYRQTRQEEPHQMHSHRRCFRCYLLKQSKTEACMNNIGYHHHCEVTDTTRDQEAPMLEETISPDTSAAVGTSPFPGTSSPDSESSHGVSNDSGIVTRRPVREISGSCTSSGSGSDSEEEEEVFVPREPDGIVPEDNLRSTLHREMYSSKLFQKCLSEADTDDVDLDRM